MEVLEGEAVEEVPGVQQAGHGADAPAGEGEEAVGHGLELGDVRGGEGEEGERAEEGRAGVRGVELLQAREHERPDGCLLARVGQSGDGLASEMSQRGAGKGRGGGGERGLIVQLLSVQLSGGKKRSAGRRRLRESQ